MQTRAIQAGVLMVASVLLSLAIAEGLVRALGHNPKQLQTRTIVDTELALDTQLGWQSRPGSHASWEAGHKVANIETDRTRRVLGPDKAGASELLLLGDSFTLGLGVEDQDTFASLLNEQFRGLKVVNFGTAGYGTYQSLLRLRAELPSRQKLKYIVYGLNHLQADRNVAAAGWVLGLNRVDGSNVVPPHVRLSSDRILEFPGRIEPMWPGEQQLALVTLARSLFLRAKYRVDLDVRSDVTNALIREMDALARAQRIPFFLIVLTLDDESLKRQMPNNVRYADCRLPGGLTPDMRLGGGGHPNERAHKYWAQCIAQYLRQAGEV